MSLEQVDQKFLGHLAMLETVLSGQPWLLGATRTIADIAVSSQLDEMLRTSHMKERILSHSHVKEWLERN